MGFPHRGRERAEPVFLRHERRMCLAMQMHAPETNLHYDRMKHRALKALQFLPPYEKRLLEDHLIEGVTLGRLGREQQLDKRTVRKRIKQAIESLREAEKDLP
jgi:DNA-directed RNA polymerase specialized sigma24 family protein